MSERGFEISQHILPVERLAVTDILVYSTPETVKDFAFQCYKAGDVEVLQQLIDALTLRLEETDAEDGPSAVEEAAAVLDYALGARDFLERELADLEDVWDVQYPASEE